MTDKGSVFRVSALSMVSTNPLPSFSNPENQSKTSAMLNERFLPILLLAVLCFPGIAAVPCTAEEPRSRFPISWRQFQQMTGPEGRSTRYIRDAAGNVRRIEAKYGSGLLIAVTEERNGFRLTIGQDIALSDIATRGWFSEAESDALIEAYAKSHQAGQAETKAGRFRFKAERDPELAIKPSVLIMLAE
jgi:hypothetical protein